MGVSFHSRSMNKPHFLALAGIVYTSALATRQHQDPVLILVTHCSGIPNEGVRS